ncbi:MAG: hypothetical protein ACO3A2_02925, partial [Bdellovibrionia bacterium]
VSPDSGIIYTQASSVVGRFPELSLIPSVRSVIKSLNLIPETYTLTPTNLLNVQSPLQQDESQFIGLEVPEGPALVQISDSQQAVLWSELTIASPHVITWVGADAPSSN